MRIVAIAALCLLATGTARADQRTDLEAKGEQLAKEGRFGEAVDQFKAADRLLPRASHACLIALAYTRVEKWPQAELYLALCHKRVAANDPLPDWVPGVEKQMQERLDAANVAAVSIEVTPKGAPARMTVSSFAPDEVFEPQTIHLPIGTHVIFLKAEGYADKQTTVEVTDKTPKHVVIDLGLPQHAQGHSGNTDKLLAPPPGEGEPHEQPAAPSHTGLYLMIGGGVVALAGIGAHLEMAAKRSKIDDQTRMPDYNAAVDTFHTWRAITIGCYVGAAALLVTGYVLHRRAHAEGGVTVSAAPLAEGGAFVSLGWSP